MTYRPAKGVRLFGLLGVILPVLLATAPSHAFAIEPRRPGQESSLTRAVFGDGRLWLLSDAGVLSSITEDKETRAEENLPEPAIDLCLHRGTPTIVTCQRALCTNWTLRRWVRGAWSVEATLASQGDDLVGLSCSANTAILLTTGRLIDVSSRRSRVVPLSEKLRARGVATLHATRDHAFVGINAGEWGGGLRRVDRRSGSVSTIQRNETGGLCGGPLNPACDPVNGIASTPWKPDCIVVAIGLVHFRPHGRLVEVCGERVQRLYYKPIGEDGTESTKGTGDEPFGTVAFFGLAHAGGALWAVGIDGLYRVDAGATVHSAPLPNFKTIGDIEVSFDLPHLIVVLTSVNQRRSISGSVPMLVPR
jgi:hypothetical protein